MKAGATSKIQPPGRELLVTIREAGRRLGIGRSKTYELLRDGALSSVRIGSARRIVVADLEEFVRRLKEEAGE
jgi:excisionase family DNA binding protein